VEKLILRGTFSSALVENITSLPSSVRELHIDGAINSVVYAALLKLGPELTKLQFNQGNSQQVDITPIDMYKVLAACPKLKSFHFFSGNRPVLKRNSSESALLPSDYFQDFERFFSIRSNETH
jgi:hypothetical protein